MTGRRLLRPLAGFAVLASLVLPATPAPADASVKPQMGVIAVNQPSDSELARMGRGGIDVYRANFYWPAVQPFGADSFWWNNPDGHDYDSLVCRAAENGIQVLPTVYGSPDWANGGKAPQTPPVPARMGDFSNFLAAAAARYGPGGSIWTDADGPCAGVTPKPITTWQIWNEPNLKYFWGTDSRPVSYRDLLVAARAGLQSSGAKIMLAGLSPRPKPTFGTKPLPYLRGLYESGAKPYFDVMAAHPYDLNPTLATKQVADLRAVMKSRGDNLKPLWVTEIGWASAGPKTGLTVSPKIQARYLETIWKTARDRSALRIKGIIWYSFRDVPYREVDPPASKDGWTFYTGLFNSSGAPKTSWTTLTRLTGGNPN